MKIKLGRDEMLDLQISMKKEYLLTNGKGGYCSSTIYDCHSRKYHGLLVCPIDEIDGDRRLIFLQSIAIKASENKPNYWHRTTNCRQTLRMVLPLAYVSIISCAGSVKADFRGM